MLHPSLGRWFDQTITITHHGHGHGLDRRFWRAQDQGGMGRRGNNQWNRRLHVMIVVVTKDSGDCLGLVW